MTTKNITLPQKITVVGTKLAVLWSISHASLMTYVFVSNFMSERPSSMGLINTGFHLLLIGGISIVTSFVTLPLSPILMYNWFKH